MVSDAMQMVRDALDAFVDLDLYKAREVIRMDIVDQTNIGVIEVLTELMVENRTLCPRPFIVFQPHDTSKGSRIWRRTSPRM